MKFALYIDYKKIGDYEYITLGAKTLEEAIEAADKIRLIKERGGKAVYLTRIMKKFGRTTKDHDMKVETYEAILCRRSEGWHRNTPENAEAVHIAQRFEAYGTEWFECQ